MLAVEASAQASCGGAGQASCAITSHPGLDVKGFADDFADLMQNRNIKGYGITVRDRDGKGVVYMSSGTAITSTDNGGRQVNFSSTTKSAIGSVSKVLTEAAVRHAIELNRSGPAYSSCRVSLNTPFLDLLPSVYREVDDQGVTPGYYRGVTVEQILQHRGGIPDYHAPKPSGGDFDVNGEPWDYWMMMDRANTTNPDPNRPQCRKGVGCYSNDNYVIATTLLPAILDCDFRDDLEDYVEWACRSRPAGRSRQSCELQRAFDIGGQISNGIVEEKILDRVGVTGACDPMDLVNAGWTTARSYANRSATTGGYVVPSPLERGCGVGEWHMSSRDLASAIRFVHEGTFFLDQSNRQALPDWHNGAIAGYSAVTHELGGGLRASFVTNSPENTGSVTAFLDQAYGANRSLVPILTPTPPVMVRIRGDWRCTRNGDRAPMVLQAYGTDDVAGYHPQDFGGIGSNEVWDVSSQTTTAASGTYVFYPTNESPLGSAIWRGTWSLTRTSSTALSITRRDDATGWTGTYQCTR